MRDPGFTVTVDADTSAARRDADAFRREQESRGVDVDVDADTAGATAEMVRWRASQEANDVHVRIDVDTSRARSEVAGLNRTLESFGRSDLLRLNLGAAGIAGLPAMATGLAQVAASMQQVAQAGLALPGILAGAGASISTLVLGLSGVKDAWDAVSSAAESSGADQVAQARAAAQANNQLRNSNVDLQQAYKDVARATRDAKQELTDLRIEQRGGMIDESRAILEAQKAREDLLSGNYSDVRDAQLRVLEADQRLVETRNRNAENAERLNDANAKGVAGSDQVVAANERVARAQQQVADAQTAVADSGTKSSAAQDKAAKAMEKLGPSAQQVVTTLHNMAPAFQDFRTAISEPLLAGKADEFRDFFGDVAPIVQNGMAGIAAGWNQNITALFGAVSSEQGKGLIDRILGNTGDAQARLSDAMGPLVEGVGTLLAAGTDALPRMADGLTSVLERFRDFITEADQDGRLEKWIDDGLDGLADLGNSVLNIGKSFTAITQAVEAGGGRTFLEWLRDGTERLQTFLNSTEGQNQLKEFFAEGRDIFNQWRPILQDLPGLFRGVMDGAQTYIGGVLKVVEPLTNFLSDHPGLVQTAVASYAAFSTVNGITELTKSLTGVSNLLGTSLPASAAKGAAGITAALGPVAALVAAIAAVDPERHLTGDKSIMQAADQGDWGRVLFGDGWDWIKNRLNIGGDETGQPGQTNQPRAGISAFPAPVQGPGVVQPPPPPVTPGPAVPVPSQVPPVTQLDPRNPFAGYATGGPTPGPRHRGFLAELHGQEWVHDAGTVQTYGPDVMDAMWRGQIDPKALRGLIPGFETGGPTDPNDPNYIGLATGAAHSGSGALPGPALIAPNPLAGGGVTDIFGKVATGVQGPINTGVNVLGGLMGGQQQSPVAAFGSNLLGGLVPGLNGAGNTGAGSGLLPGFAGLFQAGSNPALLQQWGAQTGEWLGNWGANTLLSFGSTLLNGVLGFFGAEGLMQHPVLQGIGKGIGHLGTVAGQLGQQQPSLAFDPTALLSGDQTSGSFAITPEMLNALYGTGNGAALSPSAARAIEYAQTHAVGQEYVYGGTGGGAPDGGVGGYDCSGIASSIYAAAKGLPTSTRYFTTESDFESMGFKPGYMPGALNIGVERGGGGPNSHMALTLPNGVNVESGGGHGTTAYGGPAKGATEFPLQWYLPLPADTKAGGIIPGLFDGIPNIGMLPAGLTIAHNKTGQPEMVLPPNETRAIRTLAKSIDRQPLPRPPDANQIQPQVPFKQLPAPVADPRQPPPSPPPPVAQQPPPQAPQPGPSVGPTTAGSPPPVGIVAPPSGIDHTLPWINQAIMSTASTLGNIASTAVQAAAAAGSMGASAAAGGMGAGSAGSLIAGGIQQVGKVGTKVANVISSALVGSVPGSFTDTPSGQVMRAEQRRPDLAEYRSGVTNYQVQGYEPSAIAREIQMHQALQEQARLAAIPR